MYIYLCFSTLSTSVERFRAVMAAMHKLHPFQKMSPNIHNTSECSQYVTECKMHVQHKPWKASIEAWNGLYLLIKILIGFSWDGKLTILHFNITMLVIARLLEITRRLWCENEWFLCDTNFHYSVKLSWHLEMSHISNVLLFKTFSAWIKLLYLDGCSNDW